MQTLSPDKIAFLLERKQKLARDESVRVIALDEVLATILEKANEFVPSVSGSILLDDPQQKLSGRNPTDLVFASCFGPRSSEILGQRVSSARGIVGQVYRRGKSVLANDTAREPSFDDEYDQRFNYESKTLLCVPIFVERSICGVIELVNKLSSEPYSDSDRKLLEIFAEYISSNFQNILNARQIERMARTDNLTGLLNDRYLYERLKEELGAFKGEECFSVLFLDLDHFKSVNDVHGHLAGSAVLAEYGEVLRQVVGETESLMARYGGDEFVIALPRCSMARARQLGETIRARTQEHVFLAETWGHGRAPLGISGLITVSIGITTWKPKEMTADSLEALASELLNVADQAMYESKAKGRNRLTAAPHG
jgi:diguanylate cyclase (GGDEF)-like protein